MVNNSFDVVLMSDIAQGVLVCSAAIIKFDLIASGKFYY